MADGLDGLRSSPVLSWMGTLSIRAAMLALSAGTLLGLVITLVLSQEPGWLLGFFIIIGTLAAALGVRRGAVYLFFPLPTLAFFVAAVLTGLVKDSSLTSSSIGVRVGFLQWIADIFFPMVVATLIVLLVGGGRWVLGRQLVMGRSLPADRPGVPGTRPAPGGPAPTAGSRRTPPAGESRDGGTRTDIREPRTEQDRPAADRAPRIGAPRPAPNGTRPARPAQEGRDARDPWGDPRSPADRPQPGNAQRPRSARDPREPRDPSDPRDARAQRSDRPAPQPQPRDPRDRPQRPRPRDPGLANERDRIQRQPGLSRNPWDHR